MASFGTVALKDIWAMLTHCAHSYQATTTKHNWRITYSGLCYPSLPLGPHGNLANPDIQIGHVKKMARTLDILACAKQFLNLK